MSGVYLSWPYCRWWLLNWWSGNSRLFLEYTLRLEADFLLAEGPHGFDPSFHVEDVAMPIAVNDIVLISDSTYLEAKLLHER